MAKSWSDLKAQHMSPARVAKALAAARKTAAALPPRTADGRLITEERARELDEQAEAVAKWLELEANEADASMASQIKAGILISALESQLSARVLRLMADAARKGHFLPRELRPCIDAAGNRGSHLEYVRNANTSKEVKPYLVCAFCGRA